jgi:hypothetical protein
MSTPLNTLFGEKIMLKLIIEQKGLLFNIPEISSIKTPAEVLILPNNLHEVISYLDTNGVEDYKVISVADLPNE